MSLVAFVNEKRKSIVRGESVQSVVVVMLPILFFGVSEGENPSTRTCTFHTPGIPSTALTSGLALGRKYTTHNPEKATTSPVNFSNHV